MVGNTVQYTPELHTAAWPTCNHGDQCNGLCAGGGGGGGVAMCPLCRFRFKQGPGTPHAGDEVSLHGGEYSSVHT